MSSVAATIDLAQKSYSSVPRDRLVGLTAQVAALKAEHLHSQLDDLTRLVPTLNPGRARASQPLSHQHLPPRSCCGLELSSRIGSQLLLQDYTDVLWARAKAARTSLDTFAEDGPDVDV